MIKSQFCLKVIFRNMSFLMFACFSTTYTISIKDDIPVKIRYFHVQTPRLAGESALLSCHYELNENETLYAVKWYKDYREFFRYIPAGNPKYKTLTQPGVNVDSYKSNHREVYLKNLGLESPGNYTCQVSTDGPYFWCVQRTRYLDVVVPPSNGPVLMMEHEKSDFELGDNISIQCTSGRGKPAPQLMWYINDRPAELDPMENEVIVHPDSLESSSLVLRFHLRSDIFVEGKVVLKCVASLHQMQVAAFKEILAGSKKLDACTYVWLLLLMSFIHYVSLTVLPA